MIDYKKIEAVIFDMDGVLIDSEPLWKIAMEKAFTKVGCELTRKDFQKTVGLRIDEVIQFWHAEKGWDTYSCEEVEFMIISELIRLINLQPEPLTGVIETLQYLKKEKIKIALATSSSSLLIETVLAALKVKPYFEITHSAENELLGKPHPAVYLAVSTELNVDPKRCLVIEDSLNGIISGKAARMNVVCIPEKSHFPEPKLNLADAMFTDMREFLQKFKEER